MNNLRETQHKRVVALAGSTLVFCLFSIFQLFGNIFDDGGFDWQLKDQEIYLASVCTLIMMAVVVIVIRSFEDHATIQFFEFHDQHTGLPNVAKLKGLINRRFAENDASGFLLLIDLARLKAINNSMGNETGDQALAAYGARLRHIFEEPNVVAKVYGGTFAVLLPMVNDEIVARKVGEQLQRAVAIPVNVMDRALFLSIDLGGCFLRDVENGATQALQRAELALIDAKKQNIRGTHVYTEELAERIRAQSRLETDLHEVLEREGLEPFFQPLVCEDGETIIGYEALVRWKHPQDGFIAPNSFVPVAEELNLTEKLGRQIMLKACRRVRQLDGMKVSVNVSAKDISRPGFVAEVQSILLEADLEPTRLEIEVTESIFMGNIDEVAEKISDLRMLGVSVALDDFGTGYSGLSYLDKFKVDRIKIDQAFVQEIEKSRGARSMISTIIGLARARGYEVTVEGVETRAQFEFLRQFPGLVYQGFLFSRPIEFDKLLEAPFKVANPLDTPAPKTAIAVDDDEEELPLVAVSA